MIHVAVVDDDDGARLSLECVLKLEQDCLWGGACQDAEEALETLPKTRPDVVLMDIGLPGMDGVECTRRLKELLPLTKVIMLSGLHTRENVLRAVEAGADGFLCKSGSSLDCLAAVRDLMRGGKPLCDQAAKLLIEAIQERRPETAWQVALTKRELDVIEGLDERLSEKEIAEKLGINVASVHRHVHNIYHKLHVHSWSAAVQAYYGRLSSRGAGSSRV